MSISKKKIIALLEESQVGFSTAKSEEAIKTKVSEEGYDEARLDELLELNKRLSQKLQDFENRSAEQLKATDKLKGAFKKEMREYSTSRKIARKTFTGENFRGLRSELGIDQKIKTDIEGFIEQATQFYNASGKSQESFKLKKTLTSRLSNNKIAERITALETLKVLNQDQENAKGKANVSREERDAAYMDLRMDWENFKITCRNIFSDNQEYLKILKIKPIKERAAKKTPVTPGPSPSETNKSTPGPVNEKPTPTTPDKIS